jgi:hypothetical protein
VSRRQDQVTIIGTVKRGEDLDHQIGRPLDATLRIDDAEAIARMKATSGSTTSSS